MEDDDGPSESGPALDSSEGEEDASDTPTEGKGGSDSSSTAQATPKILSLVPSFLDLLKGDGSGPRAASPTGAWVAHRCRVALSLECPGWSEMDGLAFSYGFNRFGKHFHQIARIIPGKATKDVVAYYYGNKYKRTAASLAAAQRTGSFTEFESLAGRLMAAGRPMPQALAAAARFDLDTDLATAVHLAQEDRNEELERIRASKVEAKRKAAADAAA